LHVGVTAQDVMEAFFAEGLDATRYGVLCYDQWDNQPEVIENGKVIDPGVNAGGRYGIRYSELAQWQIAGINARLPD